MKLASFAAFEKTLAAGPLAPVWLLSCAEALASDEAADALRAAARSQGYAEREVYFVERSAAWDEMLQSAQSMSLFASRKLIEVRMPGGKPGHGAKSLMELIKAAHADCIVAILTEELDWQTQKAEWVKAAQDRGVWLALGAVEAAQFPQWLAARARRAGVQLDAEALALLASRTEGNLLAAHQEIQKLALSGLTQVGVAEVRASATDSNRYDVFQLGEALLAGDARRALRILASLRGEGTEPTLVLWAILQELRNLWTKAVPGENIAGVWSSNTQQLPAALSRLRGPQGGRALFRRLAERAARADRMIKGRLNGDPWDEITQLSLEFAGQRVLPLPRA